MFVCDTETLNYPKIYLNFFGVKMDFAQCYCCKSLKNIKKQNKQN